MEPLESGRKVGVDQSFGSLSSAARGRAAPRRNLGRDTALSFLDRCVALAGFKPDCLPICPRGTAKTRMDKRFTRYVPEDWRVCWLFEVRPCRTPIGADLRGVCFSQRASPSTAACSQQINNALKDDPCRLGLPPRLANIDLTDRAPTFRRHQRFNSPPKIIRYIPRLDAQ